MGDAFPACQNLLNDEGKSQCRDGEINAVQAQRRQSHEVADQSGERAGQHEIDRQWHAVFLCDRGGVCADRQKRRMADRDLTGLT